MEIRLYRGEIEEKRVPVESFKEAVSEFTKFSEKFFLEKAELPIRGEVWEGKRRVSTMEITPEELSDAQVFGAKP